MSNRYSLEVWGVLEGPGGDGCKLGWNCMGSYPNPSMAWLAAAADYSGCQCRVVPIFPTEAERERAPDRHPRPVPSPEAAPVMKTRPDLIPADALIAVGRVLAWGQGQPNLDPDRWLKVSAREHLGPAMRHVLAHLTGQHTDPGTGEPHLACAAARVLYALAQHGRGH